ncbi:thioredoxin reductase 3 isoform X5 [Neophocaena asiaeorientalis asiaeorientalis]|uniref:thioredoxin-disulfide reductase (NADPH) n=1 Tax=Neophocaena asiaeorientalis asiaeorientalis TaxID=1706337 RepID=A0A341CWL3_NEOAA|nr:thioredoxin reductase 3 isoform X5 [Neophocaena asiaeorientalis asiaeorientalis]
MPIKHRVQRKSLKTSHTVSSPLVTPQAHQSGVLQKLLQEDPTYDYDLIVIGGGSGGLSCAQEAAALGRRVMVLDLVVPSPQGTSWGVAGTCVNVGCVPKKLMHQAALLGQALTDSRKFGWECSQQVKHNWETMTEAIQKHVGSLNRSYQRALREKAVAYVNSYGEFVEHHKIKATNGKGQETYYTAAKFVIATGERPRYLGIQGDKEYCITSDDFFSLPYCPGATLVVGASSVALECAGFLAGLGLEVTVMVSSQLLRGFDQEMAEKVASSMQQLGVRFLRKFVPVEVQQLEKGSPGKLKVVAKSTEGTEIIEGLYNTVLLAIGRDSCTKKIGLEKIGVKVNEKTGKIPVNDVEQSSVPYVYAVGDVVEGQPELTPVAVQAGRLLARRLFGGRLEKVYHTLFWPLEWTVACRDSNTCYAKIICSKFDNDRVIGFHVLGPKAGEITQGFAAAMKCGLTKQLLDDTIGIHPTCAQVFTTLETTKSSGLDITQKGC